jgi:hypothetical protein
MRETEVRGSTGLDLVESMLAVFREVTPAMNLCMQIELADLGRARFSPMPHTFWDRRSKLRHSDWR